MVVFYYFCIYFLRFLWHNIIKNKKYIMTDIDYLEEYNNSCNRNSYENILFYNPKIEQNIDDSNIIAEVFLVFPKLKDANLNKTEKEERRIFLEFLQEKEIVEKILNKYDITIMDLIKIFYRRFSYIFNTLTYSNMIRKIIDKHGYKIQ